jgi:hypothetical protein
MTSNLVPIKTLAYLVDKETWWVEAELPRLYGVDAIVKLRHNPNRYTTKPIAASYLERKCTEAAEQEAKLRKQANKIADRNQTRHATAARYREEYRKYMRKVN